MLPDNDVLKGLLSDSKKLFGIASSSATIDLQRMAPALATEVIALRERLATVEGERDAAKKEAIVDAATDDGWELVGGAE